MGMYYMFMNDSDDYDLEDDFPDGLGWFCERVGAWGEDSEFIQMERILDIDLSLLDHNRYSWDDEDIPGMVKTNTRDFRKFVESVKDKISTQPNYHEGIIYRDHGADLCKEYLSSREILSDLDALLRIMDAYEDKGIREFELSYG